jgi:hypothetical protein
MSPAKGDIRPDRVLRFRLRERENNSLAQIQNVLQELHPQT